MRPDRKDSALSRIPVLRMFHRFWWELSRPAPHENFTDYGEYWDARIRASGPANVLHRHQWIASQLEDGERVLDVGCGDGAFLRHVSQTNNRVRIVGADISPSAVAAATSTGCEAHTLRMDTRLCAQFGRDWDTVVLMEVIEHVHDAEDLFSQLLELNPGRLFITLPNTGFLLHRIRLAVFGRFPITTIIYHMKEHIRFWTVTDFKEWVALHGAEVVRVEGQLNRRDALTRLLARTWPALFAAQVIYEILPSSPLQTDAADPDQA